jgi:RNA polymerase sigma-70 factor (ECF subfamily)
MSSPTERVLPVPFLCSKEEAQPDAAPEKPESQLWDDETLMVSLKAGDKTALVEMFRRYSRLVLSIAIRILRDVAEAEEIVQEVFLFLHQRAADFDRNKGDARGWVVQLAYHRSLDRQRFLRRRETYLGTNEHAVADTLARTSNLDRHIASRQSREQLKEAFENLSERQRRTLELFFFEDLDYDEIADRIGESQENVRHYYYRGLQKLRKDAQVKKLRDRQP